jgi:hypothetical protein
MPTAAPMARRLAPSPFKRRIVASCACSTWFGRARLTSESPAPVSSSHTGQLLEKSGDTSCRALDVL